MTTKGGKDRLFRCMRELHAATVILTHRTAVIEQIIVGHKDGVGFEERPPMIAFSTIEST